MKRDLHDECDNLRAALAKCIGQRDEARTERDNAYAERGKVVAALSKLYPSKLARPGGYGLDPKEHDGWQWIVFIELPTGQVSWHISDAEADSPVFAHLARDESEPWDGHTTDEKYARLASLTEERKP